MDFRNRATYDGCRTSQNYRCSTGNCGLVTNQQIGIIDRSTNAPQSNRQWCETETVQQRKVPTDKPFQLRWAFSLTQILLMLYLWSLHNCIANTCICCFDAYPKIINKNMHLYNTVFVSTPNRASSCCWIRTRNRVSGWRFQTQVDLGSRSDTGKPNRSPDIAILPFLR